MDNQGEVTGLSSLQDGIGGELVKGGAHLPAADEIVTSIEEDILNTSRSLEEAVFTALGAASVCWDESPRGIFLSDRAKAIGDALMARIQMET